LHLRSPLIAGSRPIGAIDAVERRGHLQQLCANRQQLLVKNLTGGSHARHFSLPLGIAAGRCGMEHFSLAAGGRICNALLLNLFSRVDPFPHPRQCYICYNHFPLASSPKPCR
jgi:hypothetical protein